MKRTPFILAIQALYADTLLHKYAVNNTSKADSLLCDMEDATEKFVRGTAKFTPFTSDAPHKVRDAMTIAMDAVRTLQLEHQSKTKETSIDDLKSRYEKLVYKAKFQNITGFYDIGATITCPNKRIVDEITSRIKTLNESKGIDVHIIDIQLNDGQGHDTNHYMEICLPSSGLQDVSDALLSLNEQVTRLSVSTISWSFLPPFINGKRNDDLAALKSSFSAQRHSSAYRSTPFTSISYATVALTGFGTILEQFDNALGLWLANIDIMPREAKANTSGIINTSCCYDASEVSVFNIDISGYSKTNKPINVADDLHRLQVS